MIYKVFGVGVLLYLLLLLAMPELPESPLQEAPPSCSCVGVPGECTVGKFHVDMNLYAYCTLSDYPAQCCIVEE